jgi:hypothetical protein
MDLRPGKWRRFTQNSGGQIVRRAGGARIFSRAFEKYVDNKDDVIGLIAYSFYKKAKVDWLRHYKTNHNKDADETRIHEWAEEHLTDEMVKECKHKAFLLVESYRTQEIIKANEQAWGQIQDTHKKVNTICDHAESTLDKVSSLTGTKGFIGNIATNQVAFVSTLVLAGLLYLGLSVNGLEPLKFFTDLAPTNKVNSFRKD